MTFADKLRLIPTIPEDATIDEYIDGRIGMVEEWHEDIQSKCTIAAQKGKTSLALSLRTYILKSNFITDRYNGYDRPPRWFYGFVQYHYDENLHPRILICLTVHHYTTTFPLFFQSTTK